MGFQVTIEPLNETIEVEEGQTILDAALRAGIPLSYACNHGVCGTCKLAIIEGEIDHGDASSFALVDLERNEGVFLACCAVPQSDLVVEGDIEDEPDAKRLPIRDYDAQVVSIRNLTPSIKGVSLQVKSEFEFQAGQYINIWVPGEKKRRAFSIASPPGAENLELQVRRVEGGHGTTWIHDQLVTGDLVKFTGPLGRFYARESKPEPLLLLAGGSGLSAIKSIALYLLEKESEKPVTLIHGVRNLTELYSYDELSLLETQHSNFTYVPAISEANQQDGWTGEMGMVHEVAIRLFDGQFENLQAYLCGPPAMIDACLTSLMRGRLFEDQIFTESFYTAADGSETSRRSALFKRF